MGENVNAYMEISLVYNPSEPIDQIGQVGSSSELDDPSSDEDSEPYSFYYKLLFQQEWSVCFSDGYKHVREYTKLSKSLLQVDKHDIDYVKKLMGETFNYGNLYIRRDYGCR